MRKRSTKWACLLEGLNLQAIHPQMHAFARKAFQDADAAGLVFTCESPLCLVADNMVAFKRQGIYEECLLLAYTETKGNHRKWTVSMMASLFTFADKTKLRIAGSPIPDLPVLRVFRGVGGIGRSKRQKGYSWTLSLDTACWFAARYARARPTVLAGEIVNEEVLAYSDDRHEQEVFGLPNSFKPLPLSSYEITAGAERHQMMIVQSELQR